MNNTLKLFKKVEPIIQQARTDPELAAQIMDRLRFLHDQNVSMNSDNVTSAFTSPDHDSFLRSVNQDPKYIKVKHSPKDIAQNTFLLNSELQKQIFLDNGWIPAEDQTGRKLVNKATKELERKTKKNIPIFQKFPNDVKREDLIPLGNIFISSKTGYDVLTPDIASMGDMGDYQTTLYLHRPTGKIYQLGSDLYDYGNNSGGLTGLTSMLGLHPGDELDKIGNPVIITSGYREVPKDRFLSYLLDQNLQSLQNRHNDLQKLLYEEWEGHLLPELVVTPPTPSEVISDTPLVTSRNIRFKKGGKLISKKQVGGITPNPIKDFQEQINPIVYVGKKGTSPNREAIVKRIYNEHLVALRNNPNTKGWDNLRLSNLAKSMTAHKIAENGWVYGKGGPWAGYGTAKNAQEFVDGMFKNFDKSMNSTNYTSYVKNLDYGKLGRYNSVNPRYIQMLLTDFGPNSRVWGYLNNIN